MSADKQRLPSRRASNSTLASQLATLPDYRRLQTSMTAALRTGIRNPYFSCHDGVAADTVLTDGKQCVSFASYNYLGLSGHRQVTFAAQQAIARYGTSVSASRLVSGERPLHRQLEQKLAEFVGTEAALVLVSGHATNVSTLGHLLGPDDLVLHDVLAHNSIVEGCRLSGARRRAFPHNDLAACERLLARLRHKHRFVVIAIEGVYSMDGDFPDLPRFVELKQRYDAFLYVDEAHSLGTLGPTGRGLAEKFGIDTRDVDLWMGTLSKALGSCGGYIAAERTVIEYLKYTLPGFVFSVGITPANAAAATAALDLICREPARVTRLQANADTFLSAATAAGLNTGASQSTPIIPTILGDAQQALEASQQLLAAGINVSPILPPAVSERGARLRFFVTSEHSHQQIHTAVETLAGLLSQQAEETSRPHSMRRAG